MKNKKDIFEKINYNILSNFINPENGDYLSDIFSILEKEDIDNFYIDLLKKYIFPQRAETSKLHKVVFYANRLLLNDLSDFKIDIEDIKEVIVSFAYIQNAEKTFEVIINTEITDENDTYSKKIKIGLVKLNFLKKFNQNRKEIKNNYSSSSSSSRSSSSSKSSS